MSNPFESNQPSRDYRPDDMEFGPDGDDFEHEYKYKDNEDEDDNNNNHSLPVPEEVKTENVISSLRRQEEEDSRASFQKTRRRSLMLMGASIFTFVVVIGILVAVLTSGERHSRSQAHALDLGRKSDTVTPAVWADLVTLLQTYTPLEQLQKVGTPQNTAANWMAEQVTTQSLEIPSSREYEIAFEFVQRYILATFYYALHGDGWKFQLGFLDPEKSVCDWQQRLNVNPGTFVMVNANGGPQTGGYQGDFTTKIEATIGIGCNEAGEVNYVFIPDNNLRGELPPEIGLLEAMQHFSVYLNSISGSLPTSLSEWNDLEVIILEHNQFQGPFPSYIAEKWTKLMTLSFANNQFQGNLPSFAALTNLRSMALNNNQLTGPIDVFNENSELEILFLQENTFTGEFNEDLLADVDLKLFDCSNNQITGTLTSGWYSLNILDIHNNKLSGNLPEVDEDQALEYFSAYGNNFSGEIPESMGSLASLYHLDLSSNALTGTIPETINDLEELQYLYLGDNDFDSQDFPYLGDCMDLQELSLRSCNINDVLPHFVGKWLTDLVLLDLSNNMLQGEIAQNLPNAESMRFLLLGNNNFTGTIPESFADFETLNVFTVDHNPFLTGSLEDVCDEEYGSGAELQHVLTDCVIDCPCCQTCCSDENKASCGSDTVTPNLGGDGTYERVSYIFNEELVFSNDNDPDRR